MEKLSIFLLTLISILFSDNNHTVAKITGSGAIPDIPDEIEKKGFSKPQNCILKTDKIKSLGWSGKYDLMQGKQETIEIYEENDLA